MSETVSETGSANSGVERLASDLNVAKILLEPINHALAVWARKSFELGLPAHSVIELYLNHMASVVAQIEPAGAREECTKQLVSGFAAMVGKHLDARMTTPGGVILPRAIK
jgi:hypothetical protein